MKISWPICLIVLNISLCKDQGYGDEQIIILLNQYYKDYSKERQKIRQYIRKDDLAVKRDGGVIDWGYMLKGLD